MSKNATFLLSLLLIFNSLVCISFPLESYAKPANTNQVMILYQERSFFADRRDSVSVIEELLGHFDVRVSESAIDSTDFSKLDAYSHIMVVALDQKLDNPKLFDALSHYKGQIIWLGRSIEQLIAAGNYPLHFEGENYNFVTLEVFSRLDNEVRSYPIGEKRVFYQVKSLSPDNRVYAWLGDGLSKSPFIIESRNLTYVSRVDMNEPLFYIFANYFHSVFKSVANPESQLMVSIQDVHGFTDQVKLRALVDQLYAYHIPFNVQLIPYVKMKGSKNLTGYQEIPQFDDTLKYIEDRGGHLIVETFPAEISGSEIDAIDLNTLYPDSDLPLKTYLEACFSLLIESKLHPIGISSPHRALSDSDYLYTKAHFSTFIGHLYIDNNQLIIYPFTLNNTKHFNQFYPINLGYINPNLPESFSDFDAQLSKISLVEKYFAGVFIPPDLNPSLLLELRDRATQYQLSYFDIEKQATWVRTDAYELDPNSKEGYISLKPKAPPSTLEKVFTFFSNGVLALLVFSLLLFIFIFRRSIKRTRETQFRK
jgi:hypothetical protein